MIRRIFNRIKLFKANLNYKNKQKFLRLAGAKIGDNLRLNCDVGAFGTEPYLISVGNNCLFSGGVKLFTHDGGVSVLNNLNYFDGKKMDKMQPVKIGNNVYIGTNAMVMPGVTIGDNVIIGAGAIVTRDIPSNCVAVGIPAKPIKTIEEYYSSAKEREMFYYLCGMTYKEKRHFFENKF